MQARKVNSAFRLSSKQSDSLKMKSSLDQLLGESSQSRIEDHLKDIDNFTPQSTSTSARYNTGSFNSSKDKNTGAFLGMKGTNMDSDLFGPQAGLFAQLRKTLDEIALMKKSQRHPENRTTSLFGDQTPGLGFDFTKNLLSELNKQSTAYNPLFLLEALGCKEQPSFYGKAQRLQSLEQQLQTSENSPVTKTGYQVLNSKMDIEKRRNSFHDISSLNSLEEEVDSNTKPATQLNHLSISSAHHFDGLNLKTVRSETNTSEDRFGASQSIQDISKATLQQRLEYHYARNGKYKADNDNSSEKRILLGIYPYEERIQKILTYKKKIIKWRAAHPPNRNFSGRSAVAGSKPRIKGKFVKKDEYQKYLDIAKKDSTN
jgi:hypothetical protein